jgi:hypothetical protein
MSFTCNFSKTHGTGNRIPSQAQEFDCLCHGFLRSYDRTFNQYYRYKNSQGSLVVEQLAFTTAQTPYEISKGLLKNQWGQDQNEIMEDAVEEGQRDRLILNVNTQDQAVRVLSYLQTLPDQDELSNGDKRDIVCGLFKMGSLLYQLEHEPRFAAKLMGYLNQRLDYYLLMKDWKNCLFFCWLHPGFANPPGALLQPGLISDSAPR